MEMRRFVTAVSGCTCGQTHEPGLRAGIVERVLDTAMRQLARERVEPQAAPPPTSDRLAEFFRQRDAAERSVIDERKRRNP
jgi:hypothetical protein